MGTWGVSIFSNDTAADVRGDFRESIGEGKTPEQATLDLIKQYALSDDDPEDSIPFWLGLAATQHRCGRLLPFVRDKALAILDAGADLAQWREEDPKDAPKRQAALDKLRATLLSPQPKPMKIKRPFPITTDWKQGHAISYRLRSGRLVIMRGLHIDVGKSTVPICELCDWVGDSVPDAATIASLPQRHSVYLSRELARFPDDPDTCAQIIARNGKFTVYAGSPRQLAPTERVAVVATGLKTDPARAHGGGATFNAWPDFDDYLANHFDLH
jgi:hypothetical protein